MKMILKDGPRVQPRYSAPQPCLRVWHVARLADETSPNFWCPAQTHSHPPPRRQANRRLARIGSRVCGLVPLCREAKRSADRARFRQSTPKCGMELRHYRPKIRCSRHALDPGVKPNFHTASREHFLRVSSEALTQFWQDYRTGMHEQNSQHIFTQIGIEGQCFPDEVI